MNAIEARELKKSFNGVAAVNGVSFSVREGEVFGFLGPNGAGKTTTIRMLVGLLKPDGGKAFIMGYDVIKNPIEARELIGVVPEESNPYPDLSAWDNLRLVGMLYALPGKEIRERGMSLLKLLGIEEVKDRKVRGFSKGMKQKLLIAMALIGGPRVLFLDEPTSGLDVFSVRKIHELISELSREGVTVFLTTHNVEEAGAICDRVAIIDKGRIVAMGSPDELKIKTGGYLYLSVVFDREVGGDVKEILGDYEFKLGGRKLLVVCKEPGEVIGRIVDYARAKGLKIERVRTSEPSMAEVFMRIVGAK
ncbi:MAG: ABC transporter ATP-binding protein [Thaumarchaeota archaeon]|nr:ABC transporter ATP-binding protein [Nitrososphaerota archaeon]